MYRLTTADSPFASGHQDFAGAGLLGRVDLDVLRQSASVHSLSHEEVARPVRFESQRFVSSSFNSVSSCHSCDPDASFLQLFVRRFPPSLWRRNVSLSIFSVQCSPSLAKIPNASWVSRSSTLSEIKTLTSFAFLSSQKLAKETKSGLRLSPSSRTSRTSFFSLFRASGV